MFSLYFLKNSFKPRKALNPLLFKCISNKKFEPSKPFKALDTFLERHLGPTESEIQSMLKTVGYKSLEEMCKANVPSNIVLPESKKLKLNVAEGENEALANLKKVAQKNVLKRSFIGQGYYGTITPPVILRNILENPGWYTPYTPYQAEISQGRLEMLLNFQTMVTDFTGMDIANASLLDEATAAAEAMNMSFNLHKKKRQTYYIAEGVHLQTIDVILTRAKPLNIQVKILSAEKMDFSDETVCGVLVQYPCTDGSVINYSELSKKAHDKGTIVAFATDLLALTVLRPPSEFGADIVLGSAQRFGVPMGYGGPHAAFFATKDAYKRTMPGRLIGVSKDSQGNRAYRMTLQTREQHIRRETATSNICTAQALLANMAAAYAIYHGPKGLRAIGEKVHFLSTYLSQELRSAGLNVSSNPFFDTIRINFSSSKEANNVMESALNEGINLRRFNEKSVCISLDETVTEQDITAILKAFTGSAKLTSKYPTQHSLGEYYRGEVKYLSHPVFNSYHSETDMLRYLKKLENLDLSLANCMIPLGSCTMKLNATTEMIPVTWPEFAFLHPFVPLNQAKGYIEMITTLADYLAKITGFDAISIQPNSGSQGEFAGLRVIQEYLRSIGQQHRNVCLIPESAHGTNPASAALAGFKIVAVRTDKHGNVDVNDLKEKAEQHSQNLGALMITYPSTHGVFEEAIKDICEIIHKHGGQVYMDGANMNSQVGLTSPGFIGADVCHLNLHKTFCIPHGGGGPGMGPIGVAKHLAPFLPGHSVVDLKSLKFTTDKGINAISAAPFGSSSILPISYLYIQMLGGEGLTKATQVAILNANYIAARLKSHYRIYYAKKNGLVAHELIIDIAPFKQFNIIVDDIAKRLIDYGFHAPTMAFPIHDTLMIEPTESEPKSEIDRLCDALISIRQEIKEIEEGKMDPNNNVLKNAPHTAPMIASEKWDKPYSREKAAFPVPALRYSKYWPPVSRIDSVYGDRNLICSCPPIEAYTSNN